MNQNYIRTFFDKLLSTGDWKEFERYTYYLLKLLGIQAVYTFVDERQAGKADGFFNFGNLAVMYDCTLGAQDIEENKKEQIIDYCNRLRQGSIELSGGTTEEFHNHHKQRGQPDKVPDDYSQALKPPSSARCEKSPENCLLTSGCLAVKMSRDDVEQDMRVKRRDTHREKSIRLRRTSSVATDLLSDLWT